MFCAKAGILFMNCCFIMFPEQGRGDRREHFSNGFLLLLLKDTAGWYEEGANTVSVGVI